MQRNSRSLFFVSPGELELRVESLPAPSAGLVMVKTVISAISPGTEMLIYRDQFPADLAVDGSIAALGGLFQYPLRYGYAAVGQVVEIGPGISQELLGRLVFAFQPHSSHFLAKAQDLMVLPADISPEQAVFLPNMETAVNFVMDGAPLIGECVLVFGQGIVGLLTTALLAGFPLDKLLTVDRFPLRRQASMELGIEASFDPISDDFLSRIKAELPDGADLVFELSGAPQALDQAIHTAGFTGRVVIGSWYGAKRVDLDLGGHFHRSRIRLISSQVTTLAPELSGRWSKTRRFNLVWEMLRRVHPERWITHRFPIEQARQAYELLDKQPGEAIQVVLTYPIDKAGSLP